MLVRLYVVYRHAVLALLALPVQLCETDPEEQTGTQPADRNAFERS